MDEEYWVKNSQDAEADVVVRLVVPVPVHVRETAVLDVADDEPVLGAVGFASASSIVHIHPITQTNIKVHSGWLKQSPLFGGTPPKMQTSSSVSQCGKNPGDLMPWHANSRAGFATIVPERKRTSAIRVDRTRPRVQGPGAQGSKELPGRGSRRCRSPRRASARPRPRDRRARRGRRGAGSRSRRRSHTTPRNGWSRDQGATRPDGD